MRVVSLVPSTTQTVAALGLTDALVGCTTFCVDPPGLARKARTVGGTKNPDLAAIKSLRPDLILCNTEENRKEDIAACRHIAPVLESFPRSPLDVPLMIEQLGEHLGKSGAATAMAARIRAELDRLQQVARQQEEPKTFAYLIWRNPWMFAGSGTYIDSFLRLAGFGNVIPSSGYPSIDDPRHVAQDTDMILFSSEPWPFRIRDVDAWRDADGPGKSLLRIDGKALSWHGAETEKAATMLRLWIEGHPDPGFLRTF